MPTEPKPMTEPVTPASGKSTEKSEKYDRKLADILATAAQVFAEEGYDPASIRLVAERAGVSVAGLYYYVSSKEELLYLIQFHVFDGLVKRFKGEGDKVGDPAERLELFIRNHLERFMEDMSSLTVCSRELGRLRGAYLEKVEARQREYFAQALQIFQELDAQQEVATVDPRTAAVAMFGTINWIYTWYQSESGQSAADLARDFVQLYLHGVVPSSALVPNS
jgi:TetR/AcrR family transcriptional regulator, cholesterol catabolism regulator